MSASPVLLYIAKEIDPPHNRCMSDKASPDDYRPILGWVVEVLGDGTGPRHRRYIVGAAHREAAIAAVVLLLGPDTAITSSSPVDPEAFGISNVQPGEVIPL